MAFRLLDSDITSSGDTRILISQDFPNCLITTTVKGDIRDKSDQEKVNSALEQFYQEVFPNRAENERFDKMDKLIKESNDTLGETRKMLAQSVIKEFDNETNFNEINHKLDFLAKHLKLTYPEIEEEKHEEDEKESDSSSREAETI